MPDNFKLKSEQESNLFVLQKVIFPTSDDPARIYNLIDLGGGVHLANEQGELHLPQASEISFNSIINELSLGKWIGNFKISHLSIAINGRGKIKVKILKKGNHGIALKLIEKEIYLIDDETQAINIPEISKTANEFLYLKISSLEDATLKEIAWVTNDTRALELTQRSNQRETLQEFVLADDSRIEKVKLYVRLNGSQSRIVKNGKLDFEKDDTLDFSTLFNSFSHKKWHLLTGLTDLSLTLLGSGKMKFKFYSAAADGRVTLLREEILELNEDDIQIDLGDPAQIPGEIVYVTMTAISDHCHLTKAAWTTMQPKRREVSLAAVVTTFGREAAAIAAARRFSSETIPKMPAGKIKLYVIDNGQTLPELELPMVEVVKNANLGGAGGFTRGLIEAQQSGDFSHVLFMDDDASCEPESVWRTIRLLEHSTDQDLCVSGAMMLVDNPYMQYEKGASLNLDRKEKSIWCPQYPNIHMASLHAVAANDGVDRVNYGAWWFFAFPIAAVKVFPFPFFVRGDDADFSIANNFNIATLNGIVSWCDDFGYKLTPQVEYLAWRSWLALSFMYQSTKKQKIAIRLALKRTKILARRFDYAGAFAVITAMKDVMLGPGLFDNEPAPLSKLKMLKENLKFERPSSEDMAEVEYPRWKPAKFRWRLISKLTMGGHFLPNKLKRNKLAYVPIAWELGPHSLVRNKRVAFGKDENVIVLKCDRKKYMSTSLQAIMAYAHLMLGRRKVERLFKIESAHVREKSKWQERLGLQQKNER